MRLGQISRRDRPRLAELLAATRAFNTDEIQVALSLFDLSQEEVSSREAKPRRDPLSPTQDAEADYEFLGAFDEESEELIGYACFGATPATDGTYDLYWLAVDPAAQGRGTGTALVRAVEEKLLDRGARLLVVETSSRPDYEGTRRFYARSGYSEAARVRDFYAPADDRIVLTTRLTTR
ncbi:MAG TPA: GNAT family N-acetyltransferase [Gemmatimonadaceae bacterium]|nr:GNAT family N-acetyltransferase [Gemmatimonadaceae bacterium]